MGLLIASGVLAFLAWCIVDTDLKAEQVCNSRGEIAVWRVLAVVSAQIVLWTLVCIFAFPIVRHFPRFLVTGWRLRFTFLFAGFWQWFAVSIRVDARRHHCENCRYIHDGEVRLLIGETVA